MENYNLTVLKEQCNNDKTFFNEMLDIFISSSLSGIASMHEAYHKKDMENLGHFAHKIGSPYKHIQAEEICVLLKEIENTAKDELTADRAEFLLENIKVKTDRLIERLKMEYL